MSVGGPPVITIGDTPISVPESLDPDTDGFLDPVLPEGEMAHLSQIQIWHDWTNSPSRIWLDAEQEILCRRGWHKVEH